MSAFDPSQRRVFLACPSYGGHHRENVAAILDAVAASGVPCFCSMLSTSLLCYTFNLLWCEALNQRKRIPFTDFVMIHSDIAPENGWLPKLLQQRTDHGLDILSVAMPIKDERGVLSAGYFHEGKGVKRMTLEELAAGPDVLTCPPEDERVLCVNTGLWATDFTRPWVEKIHFHIGDNIIKDVEGNFKPSVFSEDWMFSVDAAALGLSIGQTKTIKAEHIGQYKYPNFKVWGSPTDSEFST